MSRKLVLYVLAALLLGASALWWASDAGDRSHRLELAQERDKVTITPQLAEITREMEGGPKTYVDPTPLANAVRAEQPPIVPCGLLFLTGMIALVAAIAIPKPPPVPTPPA